MKQKTRVSEHGNKSGRMTRGLFPILVVLFVGLMGLGLAFVLMTVFLGLWNQGIGGQVVAGMYLGLVGMIGVGLYNRVTE